MDVCDTAAGAGCNWGLVRDNEQYEQEVQAGDDLNGSGLC